MKTKNNKLPVYELVITEEQTEGASAIVLTEGGINKIIKTTEIN